LSQKFRKLKIEGKLTRGRRRRRRRRRRRKRKSIK
jgi:hypothetical protein